MGSKVLKDPVSDLLLLVIRCKALDQCPADIKNVISPFFLFHSFDFHATAWFGRDDRLGPASIILSSQSAV